MERLKLDCFPSDSEKSFILCEKSSKKIDILTMNNSQFLGEFIYSELFLHF